MKNLKKFFEAFANTILTIVFILLFSCYILFISSVGIVKACYEIFCKELKTMNEMIEIIWR